MEVNMGFIPGKTKEVHQRLSKVSADFLEFVEKNPGSLKRCNYSHSLETGVNLEVIQPWPVFINRQVKKQMEDSTTRVFSLIKKIPQCIFANNPQKISSYYGFPPEYVQMQLEGIRGGHLERILGRGDFVFSSLGLKCLEYNVSAALGGYQNIYLEQIYFNIPIFTRFLQEYKVKIDRQNLVSHLLQHLVKHAKNKFPTRDHPEMNIVFALPNYSTTPGLETLENYFNQIYPGVLKAEDFHGIGEVRFCDFPGLKVANQCVYYKTKRIQVLVEWYNGEVPIEIYIAFLLGNVILYDGPIGALLSNKLNLALLSENENSEIFSLEEREIIKKYIPWTRRTVPGETTYGTKTIDLEDFIYSNQVKLAIKPVREMGGKDVSIGKSTPADRWKQVVEQAMQDSQRNWIVQEYVESAPFVFQYGENGCTEHDVIWGLLAFGTEYAGGYLRLLPKSNSKGVVNCAQGAEITTIFEVDE
jgi:hypothetical protein